MADASQELLNEPLRRIHPRFDKVGCVIGALRADDLNVRGQIHALQGDVNTLRGTLGHLESKLDRIEARLELREFSELAQRPFDPSN